MSNDAVPRGKRHLAAPLVSVTTHRFTYPALSFTGLVHIDVQVAKRKETGREKQRVRWLNKIKKIFFWFAASPLLLLLLLSILQLRTPARDSMDKVRSRIRRSRRKCVFLLGLKIIKKLETPVDTRTERAKIYLVPRPVVVKQYGGKYRRWWA